MATVKRANDAFVTKWSKRKDYLQEPKVLRQALDELERIAEKHGLTGKYGYYFGLRSAQEEANSKLKAVANQITDTAVKLENKRQFFELKLAKIPATIQKKFLLAPELKNYRHYLKKLFDHAKHLLTEPEERILNLKTGPAHSDWIDMTSTLLAKQTRRVLNVKGKPTEKPFAEIISLTANIKKPVRDRAFAAMLEINARYAEVAESELNAIMRDKQINDELRGFTRPDQARHLADDIETETVEAMLAAVTAGFPIARDYYRLKADLFKKKKLDYHERNVPYGQIEQKYPWPKATALVSQVFGRLDPEFQTIFDRFVADGRIDIFPYQGKSGGAFCTHNLKSQPTYLLLNHTDRLQDVLTLAHEAGHGINNELMRAAQPPVYFDTPLATAEVASTFFEDFVLAEVRRNASPEWELSLRLDRLNDEVSTIFRQVAAYRFEQALHAEFRQQGYLAKEAIGKIFDQHLGAYLGPAVDRPQGSENLWVYWSHFRRFFYVYSYASGLLISKALQAKVRANPEFIKEVKKFLAAGSSDSPQNIFARLGLDITHPDFWQTGLDEIKQSLAEARALAKKLKKIK